MTSSIVAAMSKNRRMPDGGTLRTRSARARSASGARGLVSVVIAGKRTASSPGSPRRRRQVISRPGRRAPPVVRRDRDMTVGLDRAVALAATGGSGGATAVRTARSRIPSIWRCIITKTPKPMTGPTSRKPGPDGPNRTRKRSISRVRPPSSGSSDEGPAGGEILRGLPQEGAGRGQTRRARPSGRRAALDGLVAR